MRRVTTGKVGGPILGELVVVNNNLQSFVTNADIELSPDGTGSVIANSNIVLTDNGEAQFREGSGSGTNYVSLKSPATLSSNVALTLPSSTGSAGQVLNVDGSGNLSFTDISVSTANQTADTGRYYLLIADDADANDGSISSLTYSDNKLEFQPSSGTVYCTAVEATDVTASGNLQGGTITETSSITLKENIQPLNGALDNVLKLQGVEYDRKSTGKHEAGLIAEQVAKVLPEIVSYDKFGNAQSIAYSRLTAYLIEAVKQLSDEIKLLKGK